MLNEGQYAIVTDRYPCGSLRKLLKDRAPLSWLHILNILSEISTALYTIHKKGYSHNDLTSDNILIKENSIGSFIAVISNFAKSEKCQDSVYGNDISQFGQIMAEITSTPIPHPFMDLMERCTHENPSRRPTSDDLSCTFHQWFMILNSPNNLRVKNFFRSVSRWASLCIEYFKSMQEWMV